MKFRLLGLFIIFLNIDNCDISQKEYIREKLPPSIHNSREHCKCALVKVKNELETLNNLKMIIINNSFCENPNYGIFRLDFDLTIQNRITLKSVELETCDSVIILNDILFFKKSFTVDESCRSDGSTCGIIRVRLNYD